ncbi:hypothetical protein HOLleu_37748 [Holothuria leucospilota]|uniref:Death domain-containing protein n=1 Tax=Holothuria leucospilota TaxID=206669 RepID=A0A9Q1BCK4_HOLLE|nr:hypothetical protein HOLleu_37748 [Holothuria leucospilota]
MDTQPSSPKGQLRKDKKIFVRGADTIIRISPNAVILQTSREEGITIPDDMDEFEKVDVKAEDEERESGSASKTNRVEEEGATEEGDVKEERTSSAKIQTGDVISDDQLRELSRHLGKEWRTLALIHLGISNTDVDTITRNTSDLPDSIFRMLSLWRSRQGSNATVENLVDKLKLAVQDKSKWEFLLNSETEEAGEEDASNDPSQGNIASSVSKENPEPFEATFSGSDPLLTPPKEIPSLLLEDLDETNDQSGERAGDGRLSDERQSANVEKRDPIIGSDKSTDDKTLEDIERVSAVFAGFAEDKKDEFTSLGASMGELLQKILTLDHENKRLKTQIQNYKEQRPSEAAASGTEKNDTSCQTKEQDDDAKTQRKNYLQVKRHLQEALNANRDWEDFARKQRDESEAKIKEMKTVIEVLEEKLKMAESSSSDASRQLDSILNATETQASQIEEDNIKLRSENKELQEKLQRLAEEKRKVERFSKGLLKGTVGVESNLVPTRKEKDEKRAGRPTDITRQADPEHLRYGVGRKHHELDSYHELMEKVKTQAKPPPNAFEGYEKQKTSRPETVKGSSKQAKKGSSTADDILFLKEQVAQYQEDFQRERIDRERAASELESLRRELQETKLLLAIQRDEFPAPKAHKAKSTDRETEERIQKGIRYLDPDEVARLRNQSRGREQHYVFGDRY